MFRGIQRHFAAEGEVATGGGAAPVVAPVVATPAAPVVETEPHWLKPRLEREAASARTALLAEIGVTDPEAAKKLVADEVARKEASKSLEQRAIDAEKARDAEKLRVTELSGTVTSIATERMTGLTEAQRAAVTAIAGTDAAAQLKAIAALAPTWATASPLTQTAATTASTATTVTTPAPAPAAANTAPGPNAPAPTTTSQPDHKAEYKRLKAENPVLASAYLNKHEAQIYPRA